MREKEEKNEKSNCFYSRFKTELTNKKKVNFTKNGKPDTIGRLA